VLDFSDNHPNPDQHAYYDVPYGNKKSVIKLITTQREAGRVLHPLSVALMTRIRNSSNLESQFITAPIGMTSHVLFQFHKLPSNRHEEIEVEFPHPHTRHNKIMKEIFYVEIHQ